MTATSSTTASPETPSVLTSEAKEQCRKRLQEDLAAIEKEISRLSAIDFQSIWDTFGNDPVDRETARLEIEKIKDERVRNEGRRDGIVHALRRLDNGNYGKCVSCGGEILLARLLEFDPAADRCTKRECQPQRSNGKNRPDRWH